MNCTFARHIFNFAAGRLGFRPWVTVAFVSVAVFLLPAPAPADEVDLRELWRDDAGPGAQTIYRWTDDDGTVHVTDNPGEVPANAWPRVQKQHVPVGDSRGEPAPQPRVVPRQSDPVQDEAAQRERWRARQAELVGHYRSTQAELRQGRWDLQRAISTGAPPARVSELREQIAAAEAREQDLYRELQELPGRVRAEGGREGWLRPLAELGVDPPATAEPAPAFRDP